MYLIKVFAKLRILFEGFSQAVIPLMFILIGNFKSVPYTYTAESFRSYKDTFDQLANLVAEYPEIARNSHFVFVPGPQDPWAGNILPRPPIPKSFTDRITQIITNIYFTGNPCRIKYCSQEIVIFREDLMNIMRRNAMLSVSETEIPLEQHVYFI